MAKNKDNLLTTYEKMLHLGACIVDEDGLVSVTFDQEPEPALIEIKDETGKHDKRVVLPIPAQLKMDGGWDNRVAFHPLKESAITGESRIVEFLRKAINTRINRTVRILIDQILKYSSSPEYQKKLNSAQTELLKHAKDADENMINTFKKLMRETDFSDLKESFVNIYLKKLGKINDKQYQCIAVVSFPWFKALCASNKEFHGVKIRKVELMTYKNILKYLFNDIEVEGSFNVGVNDSIAPFAEALVRATAKLTEKLNKVAELLFVKSNHLGGEATTLYHMCYTDLSVVDTFDDLDRLLPELRMIPMLPGNEPNKKVSTGPGAINLPEPTVQDTNNVHKWETVTTNQNVTGIQPAQPVAPVSQPVQQPIQQNPQMVANTVSSDAPSLSSASWMQPLMPAFNMFNQANVGNVPLRGGVAQAIQQQQMYPQMNMMYQPMMYPVTNQM